MAEVTITGDSDGYQCGRQEAEQDGLRAGLDAAEALLAYLRSDAARRWDIRYFGLRCAHDAIVALAEPAKPSDG